MLSDLLMGGPEALPHARLDALARALDGDAAGAPVSASAGRVSVRAAAAAEDRDVAAAAAAGPFFSSKGALLLWRTHLTRMEREDLPPADVEELQEERGDACARSGDEDAAAGGAGPPSAARAQTASASPAGKGRAKAAGKASKSVSDKARSSSIAAAVAKYAPAGAPAGSEAAPDKPEPTLFISEHIKFMDAQRAEGGADAVEWRGMDELRHKVAAEQAAYYEWERACLTMDPAYGRACDAVYEAAARAQVAAAERIASRLPSTFVYHSEVDLASLTAGGDKATRAGTGTGAQLRRKSYVSGVDGAPDLTAVDGFEPLCMDACVLASARQMGEWTARFDAARDACFDAVVAASGGGASGIRRSGANAKRDGSKGTGVDIAASEGCAVVIAERVLAVLLAEDKVGQGGAWEVPIEVLREPGAEGEPGPQAVLFEPLHPLQQGTRELEARVYGAAVRAKSAVSAATGLAAPAGDCAFSVWAFDEDGGELVSAGGGTNTRARSARASTKRARAGGARTPAASAAAACVRLLVASPPTGLAARKHGVAQHVSVLASAQHAALSNGFEERGVNDSVRMWVASNCWENGQAAMAWVNAREGTIVRWDYRKPDVHAACEARALKAVVRAVLGLPRGRFVLSKAANSNTVYVLAAAGEQVGEQHGNKSGKEPYELQRAHAKYAAGASKRPDNVPPAEYVPLRWKYSVVKYGQQSKQIPRTFGMLKDKVNPFKAYHPSRAKRTRKK